MAESRNGAESALDVPPGVNSQKVVERRFRCLATLQPSELRIIERREDGAQSRRRFRMMRSRVVFETGWV
jgi:hypothetical protein